MPDEMTDTISTLSLFAGLPRPELEGIAHTFDEDLFPEGQRVLRQGFRGNNFYVIVEGEAAVRVNGSDLARLGKGDFFGEVSVLLGEPPTADVVALRPLRCLTIPGAEVEDFLIHHPRVMFRMLQTSARRLRATIEWRA
ncbi:MAG: cyclic nucleotide-binding domain-containing protein [Actinomycetota bacterium]|nr:cyclic nucleotide-binding domain-containing protein [Actinomycetota bacterium]